MKLLSLQPNFEIAEEVEISAVNLMEAHVSRSRQSDLGPSAVSKSVSVSLGVLKPEPFWEMIETIEQFQQTIDQERWAFCLPLKTGEYFSLKPGTVLVSSAQ